jgi:hypothetical protein
VEGRRAGAEADQVAVGEVEPGAEAAVGREGVGAEEAVVVAATRCRP